MGFTLWEASTDRLLEALRGGQVDAAFAGLATTSPPGIATQVVADEALVVVVSRGDPLAARTTVTLGGIRERPLICLPPGTGLRSSVDEACGAAGFRPHIAFEASDPQVLAQLAARGLGVAILPESVARAHSTELHLIALTQPRLRGRIALAWRAAGPISPAAEALITHARTALSPPASR